MLFAIRCSLFAVFIAGCGTLPVPMRALPAAPLPAELASRYDYPRQTLQAAVESTQEKDGYRFHRIQLKPPKDSTFRPILIDWYRPDRPGKLPAIVISPILAGNDLYVNEFAKFYAARGMHAVMVYRPKEVFSADRELSDIEKHFRESIIQLRQTIDWLEAQDSVDARRIGSFAISMGAVLTSVLTAVEARVKVSVLGLPAGDVAQIIMGSQDKAIRKRRKNYLRERKLTEEEALRQLQAVIVSEPMRFAPHIPPGKVLVIGGLFDRVLGIGRSLRLWNAMGRPRLILLPTGHYSAALATAYLKVVTYSFLRRGLRLQA